MPQALRSALVLAGLCLLLAVAALWGFNAATQPFPGRTDPPVCVDTEVAAGERVFPAQVTVSVFNASDRNGLASRTMGAFRDDGFHAGETGNAPRDVEVDYAQVWTERPEDPDVRLVLSRLGDAARVESRPGAGPGVTVVVGNGFEDLRRGARKWEAETDTVICSPVVS